MVFLAVKKHVNDNYITLISQKRYFNAFKPGDLISAYPIHCL